MHLKHNCKQVLGDHHSWTKNPRHQGSHLERVSMSGNAHSYNLPTITQEFHSNREALDLERRLTSWTIKPTSLQSGIAINLNNMRSSLFYTLLILPKSWLICCDEWDCAMIKKKKRNRNHVVRQCLKSRAWNLFIHPKAFSPEKGSAVT